ncbi:MAG: nSTAND1 domain-containing NTPase [Actinomycetales bacterium]
MRADDVATREELGSALTRLRELAGLSIRDLSKQTGVPSGTISGYFTGRHVPPASALPQVRALLAAVGVPDDDLAAWVDACARARRAPGRRPADAPVPYRGLQAYEQGDAAWFVGRESLVDDLEALVDKLPPAGIALLVGASGTGKSSLVRAGLLPRAQAGEIALATPGPGCLEALRRAADPLGPCLVVVDQAEELFAPGASELLAETLALVSAGPMAALLVLRSDFYSSAAEQPLLVPALQSHQLVVTPPTEDDLRRIILEPAREAGLDVEPGFVELLLRDLSPRSGREGHRPGVLALLSHALLATYERGGRRALRIADYQAIGGLEGAVARTAEDAYQQLSPHERTAARQLFLRLVHVVDGAPVARRRAVPLQSPGPEAGEPERRALDTFVAARLLTTSESGVTLTHEVLLWAWPRLRAWIDADREGQVIARTIRDAAALWDDHGRDEALLHRGAPLSAALSWATDAANAARLAPLERSFLAASEARLRQEVQRETRRARRFRTLAACLAVMLVAAVAFAGIAVTARTRADRQRQLAISRLLALTSARVIATDPGAALQLAASAYRIAPTFEARSAVLTAAGLPVPARIPGDAQPLQSVAVSRDGLIAVGGASTTVRLLRLDPSTGYRTLATLAAGEGTVFAVALRPDGGALAAGGADGKVRVWDLTDPRRPRLTATHPGPTSTVYSVAWGPDGSLAAGSADGSVWWWPATGSPSHLKVGSPVHSVAVSPDGRTVVAGSEDNRAQLWRPGSPTASGALAGAAGIVYGVAWSPDGKTVAVGGADRQVHLYDVSGASPRQVANLDGPTTWVNAVAFDPSGTRVLGASSDRSLWIWDVATGQPLSVLPHSSQVTSAAWSADGHTVTTVANDGSTRVWQVPGPVLGGAPATIFALPTTADGSLLAAGSSGGVQLWRLRDHSGAQVGTALQPSAPGARTSGTAALSPDGRLLASGGRTGRTFLWQLDATGRAHELAPLEGQQQLVEQVVFAAHGHLLAAADDDGTVALWQLSPSGHVERTAVLQGFAGSVQTVTFSPDGRYVAGGSVDRTVRVWDLSAWRASGKKPAPVGPPLQGPSSYVYSVAWSPDGHYLAAGSDDHRVWVWDLSQPTHARRIAVLTQPTSYVYSVAWSRESDRLAAGTGDGETLLWLRATSDTGAVEFHEQATVSASTDGVYAATFVGHDGTLLTAGGDRRIHLWSTDVDAAIRSACSRVGAPLTREEWHDLLPSVAYSPACPPARVGTRG